MKVYKKICSSIIMAKSIGTRRDYTTGEAARICRCSIQTTIRRFDNKTFAIPYAYFFK